MQYTYKIVYILHEGYLGLVGISERTAALCNI